MSHDNDNVCEDGLELHFSVNYLGHFLIVQLLKPLLDQSSDPRVVMLGSSLLRTGEVDLDHLGSPSLSRYTQVDSGARTPPAYCDSKLMVALFAQVMCPARTATDYSSSRLRSCRQESRPGQCSP